VVLVGLASVGSEELATSVDFVTHRGDVMGVASRAEETYGVAGGDVTIKKALDMAYQVGLGDEGLGEVKQALDAKSLGYGLVEILDTLGPDGPEHPGSDLGVGVGNVRMNGHFITLFPLGRLPMLVH